MSGPLSSTLLLLLFSLVLLHSPALRAKPLSAAHGRGRNFDGGMVRVRRDLRDSLPYEAQMMSYSPGAEMKVRASDLYNQPDAWKAKGLSQALQQLVESDQRRDQEAAYLSGIMRLLSQIDANSQGGAQEDAEDAGDFQGPYPPDYDDTEPGVSMAKPQAQGAWQDLLDPQLTQALLNRYRQERLLQEAANRIPEQREQDRDQEVLRFLVEKILSSLSPGSSPSPSGGRRAKRDVDAVAAAAASRGSPALRRSRRSLDSLPPPQNSDQVSLLRVKRLGDEDEEAAGLGGDVGQHRMAAQPVGLQRMKRIDVEPQPAKHSRKRRSLAYDPNLLAQHILQYLPQ
ncbi:proprotein convertase subtilisin/kexin type 1 inhibitor, like [Sardina pilchardus]|uniref:proprotein convertase subtilisin/kexin type 1 inhibitor, like n=1 Tax=Sardina pilchardus TaxID=27697 RepID=UPI002E0FCB64